MFDRFSSMGSIFSLQPTADRNSLIVVDYTNEYSVIVAEKEYDYGVVGEQVITSRVFRMATLRKG